MTPSAILDLELAGIWHIDHCFIHYLTAIAALLLTLAAAFLATHLFCEHTLKPAAGRIPSIRRTRLQPY